MIFHSVQVTLPNVMYLTHHHLHSTCVKTEAPSSSALDQGPAFWNWDVIWGSYYLLCAVLPTFAVRIGLALRAKAPAMRLVVHLSFT